MSRNSQSDASIHQDPPALNQSILLSFDDVLEAPVAAEAPRALPAAVSRDDVFVANPDLRVLMDLETRLLTLRRQAAVTTLERAFINRQAKKAVQSSMLNDRYVALRAEIDQVKKAHQARIAEHQQHVVEAASAQQWDKIPEILSGIKALESDDQVSQAQLESQEQELVHSRTLKRETLAHYAERAQLVTEPLMADQRGEIVRLLEQRVSLCHNIFSQAETLAEAARASMVVVRQPKISVATVGVFAPPEKVVAVIDQEAVEKLLLHVARGEQDEAEAMLKTNRDLAQGKGTVTDYSNRTFKNITAFQYALWALDWHMWTMITRYLPQEAAAEQLAELESHGTAHGKHYDFKELLTALKAYIDQYDDQYDALSAKSNGDQLRKLWSKDVGGAQTRVPAHVANEYCRPDRSFGPTPAFKEASLPRSFNTDQGNWFPLAKLSYGSLGVDFALDRGLRAVRVWFDGTSLVSARVDFSAAAELCKTRTGQYDELKASLQAKQALRFS